MKKIYLLSISLFTTVCSLTLNAQTIIEATNTSGMGEVLNNNAIIYKSTTPNGTTAHDIEIKNVSANTVTFIVRRYDDLLNTVVAGSDEAAALFCTGTNCYAPTTYTASVILTPHTSFTLRADLSEASIIGESSVHYKIYNQSNSSDEFNAIIKYNNITSVKSNSSLFSNVSNVFPTPCASNAYITIYVANSNNGVKVSMINALGTVVSAKLVDLTPGKNTLTLDSENLASGTYFVILEQGVSKITKKIIVSK